MRNVLGVLMGLLVMVFAFGQAEASLIGYWPLDGTATDATGNNDGVIYGAATDTGMVGSGLDFDGVDDFVALSPGRTLPAGFWYSYAFDWQNWGMGAWTIIPGQMKEIEALGGYTKPYSGAPPETWTDLFDPNSLYILTDLDEITISVWVKPYSLAGRTAILDTMGEGPGTYFLHQENGQLIFSSYETVDARPSYLISTGDWSHVVATGTRVDATHVTLRVYINGVLRFQDANTANRGFARRWSTGAPIYNSRYLLGGRDGTNLQFDGVIDDFAIFDTALGAADVNKIYLKGLVGIPVDEEVSWPTVSVSANPSSAELPLVLSAMQVAPQTLNFDSKGDGMTAVDLIVDEVATNAQTAAVTLTINSGDTDGTVTTLDVDYGDDTTAQISNPASVVTLTHPYGAGDYTVTVVATDDDGLTSVATASISVTAESPSNLGYGTYYLEGSPNIEGGSVTIIRITFSRQDVINRLKAQGVTAPTADVQMNLTGDAVGSDFIDVISSGSRGKSTLP